MTLKQPKTAKQEVLHHLITHGKVSIMDFPYMSGFRTRISEFILEYDITIKKKHITAVNKYFNTYTYTLHILPKKQLKKAIKIYNKWTLKK